MKHIQQYQRAMTKGFGLKSCLLALAATLLVSGIVVTKATSFPCGLEDGCSSSEYINTHYTCYTAIRCTYIYRKWCGVQGKWLYNINGTGPVDSICSADCAQGSTCIAEPPP